MTSRSWESGTSSPRSKNSLHCIQKWRTSSLYRLWFTNKIMPKVKSKKLCFLCSILQQNLSAPRCFLAATGGVERNRKGDRSTLKLPSSAATLGVLSRSNSGTQSCLAEVSMLHLSLTTWIIKVWTTVDIYHFIQASAEPSVHLPWQWKVMVAPKPPAKHSQYLQSCKMPVLTEYRFGLFSFISSPYWMIAFMWGSLCSTCVRKGDPWEWANPACSS